MTNKLIEKFFKKRVVGHYYIDEKTKKAVGFAFSGILVGDHQEIIDAYNGDELIYYESIFDGFIGDIKYYLKFWKKLFRRS